MLQEQERRGSWDCINMDCVHHKQTCLCLELLTGNPMLTQYGNKFEINEVTTVQSLASQAPLWFLLHGFHDTSLVPMGKLLQPMRAFAAVVWPSLCPYRHLFSSVNIFPNRENGQFLIFQPCCIFDIYLFVFYLKHGLFFQIIIFASKRGILLISALYSECCSCSLPTVYPLPAYVSLMGWGGQQQQHSSFPTCCCTAPAAGAGILYLAERSSLVVLLVPEGKKIYRIVLSQWCYLVPPSMKVEHKLCISRLLLGGHDVPSKLMPLWQ